MSIYTEAEHAVALTDTMHWIKHPPMTPEERYRYGRYHWRLKDYNEALRWFSMALEDHVEAAWFDIGLGLINDFFDLETNPEICRQDQRTGSDTSKDEAYFLTSDPEICFQNAWYYYSSIAVPDSEELFRKAWMLRRGLGTEADPEAARVMFEQIPGMHPDLTPEDFKIYCEYTVEGSDASAATDICKLPIGDAFLELTTYKLESILREAEKDDGTESADGKAADEKNTDRKNVDRKNIDGKTTDRNCPDQESIREGRLLLKKACDFHCEEAQFLDYRLFGADFGKYEYQDEIRQLYSFRIGQYGRVCDVNPSRKAYLRMIRMYEDGFPGDGPERRADFARKAQKYYKKIEAMG